MSQTRVSHRIRHISCYERRNRRKSGRLTFRMQGLNELSPRKTVAFVPRIENSSRGESTRAKGTRCLIKSSLPVRCFACQDCTGTDASDCRLTFYSLGICEKLSASCIVFAECIFWKMIFDYIRATPLLNSISNILRGAVLIIKLL